jgi:ADP-ribosylation factor-binding protein GGA
MNDQINNVITRFEAFKKGDYSVSANPIPAELAQVEPSLINLDDNSQSSPYVTPADDLASLFASLPQTQSYAPHSSANAMFAPRPSLPLSNNGSPSTSSPVPGTTSPQPQFGSIMLAPTPPRVTSPGSLGGTSMTPNSSSYGMLPPGLGMGSSATGMGVAQSGSLGTRMSTPGSRSSIGAMMGQRQPTSTQPTQQGKDPFADLAGLF